MALSSMYSVIAVHPDDEFIGCRKFILSNADKINNIIFLCNGEYCPNDFLGPEYAQERQEQSQRWLIEKTGIDALGKIHFINVPDTWDASQLATGFGADIYKKNNGISRLQFILSRLQEIVGDDIVVGPVAESHPSHLLGGSLMTFLRNKLVLYYSHLILQKDNQTKEPGVYIEKIKEDIDLYQYVYKEEEFNKKIEEFEKYFSYQAKDLAKSEMTLRPYEMYLSEVNIQLEF